MLTVVMYHYVRDLKRSRYPNIKGLTTERFEGQLDYLTKHYRVCGVGHILAAMRGDEKLPPNACLLSFDDGFLDHYTVVFPRLAARGLSAVFSAPARAIEERRILDVHKIHFILAAVEASELVGAIGRALDVERETSPDLPPNDALYERLAHPGRYDDAQVMFVKRALQRALPAGVRARVIDDLFAQFVTEDEAMFASELYMDVEQLKHLDRQGMEIGGHGYSHCWLGEQSPDVQEGEVRKTLGFLGRVREAGGHDWLMCYPHGSYDQTTLDLVQRHGCRLGLATEVGLVENFDAPYELRRLDTNDLPCSGDAPVAPWTEAARAAPSTPA